MGFGMAANLRAKLPAKNTLYVFDVSSATTSRFAKAASSGGPSVIVANNVNEIVENCVLLLTRPLPGRN